MAIKEIDLPEATRRNDVYNQLLEINKLVSDLSVFPSLLWTWCFDILKDIFENTEVGYDEAIREGVTLKEIFDQFWEDSDSLGLTMDHGGEILEETIRDWMREKDFIVALDDDSWLDEPGD